MAGIAAGRTQRDESVWEDDCVEVFLDTNHDHETYYQLIVNAAGTQGDAVWRDGRLNLKWDGEWEAKTRQLTDRWNAEIAIPFGTGPVGPRTLFNAKPGYWGINLCREERPHS